jgi:flagellin-like hook-associated protein FlgL
MINLSSNAAPMSASLTLARTNQNLKQSITRLSSGLRINSSFDDPAGVAVSARFNNKVLQSSALGQNLGNTLSFLETQEAYLRRLGDIYIRIQEIEIQKQDVIKSQGDISIYDTEKASLIAQIYQIRDERFNGVRLFSPDSDMDSMDADTGIINGAAETVLQFNLTNQNDPKPLEMIFLADISGSMGPYIQNVVLNISSFINSVSTRLNASSWSAKAVGYRLDGSVASPTHTFRAPNGGVFVSSIPDLTSQLTSLQGQVGGGVGGLGESLIDGVYDAINVAGGWQNTDSKKVVIGFTDEPSESPLQPGVTINGVASQLSSNDVNFYLFTNDPSDTETSQLTSQSGAVVGSLASANTDMSAALNGIVDSLITTELIDFDTLAQYIALNGAKQNRIRNLIDSNALLKNHATESLGEIRDLDVAAESVNFSRLKLLQDAGTAYVAQSNVAMNHSLFNLIL